MTQRTSVAPLLEPELCKLLGHTLRQQVLFRLGDSEASPSEIAEELGETPDRVREQIKILKQHGYVEEVRRVPGARGGNRYVYKATVRPNVTAEEWATLPAAVQSNREVAITQKLQQEMVDSLEDGAFYEDPDHVLIRRPIVVDRKGMQEVDAILCRALDEVIDVEAASVARASEEEPVRGILGLLSFPSAP